MGGDHKCPVCQATFTRPQHVARHMRSHTGDRPYKCQYCGDQFARSDLLSRHINKCHANEKPLPNSTAGGRRKGSASASRATTSKQACDQCVQSSLPCDGSNPCSKCVSRKCRCTYVKFHRQTAPSGPGHHPPRSPSTSSSVSGSIGNSRFPPPLDDFILAPPPSAPPVTSSMAGSDQIFNTPFTFNPAAPAYPTNWTAADMTHLPFSMASDADMAGKYRAQAEFLRRAGPSILSTSTPTVLPNMYATQQQHPQAQPPPSSWYPSWGESGAYPLDDTKSFDGIARSHSLASSEPASFTPDIYGTGIVGSGYRPRRGSFDFSDSSSATSHSMPSSAASSSVHLPLPGNEMYDGRSEEMHRQAHDSQMMHSQQRRSSMPTSQPPTFTAPSEPPQQPQTHRIGEGGFSSAFGLMSIDDPNVLAGLSSDGVPFFSSVGVGIPPHSPNQTPMPTRIQHPHPPQSRDRGMSSSTLPTPGVNKDTDTRELKDFWKAYMRSPLSGNGSAALDLSAPPPISQSQMPQSPSGQRRRVRVSSLPSVTPTVEKGHPLMMNGHAEGGVRMTHHGNPEDLRSYEAAVNARSASMKLNLVPRRKGTRPSSSASPPANETGCLPTRSDAGSSQVDKSTERGLSRPSSSSSTSSLAQAFTVPSHHHHSHPHPPIPNVIKPPPMQGASISLPIASVSGSLGGHCNASSVTFGTSTSLTYEPGSRESSVVSDGTGGTGGSGSDGEVFRPSFKRYPSQTLGPPSSKRALVERRGGEVVVNDGVNVENEVGLTMTSGGDVKESKDGFGAGGASDELDMDMDLEMEMEMDVESQGGGGVSVVSASEVGRGSRSRPRPIAGLPERAKRG